MTPHSPLTREFERKLYKLRGFARIVEDRLADEVAALDARVEAQAAEAAGEGRTEIYEFHAEDYFELADELPTILRYAVLTAADTALEVHLNNTCETYAEVWKSTVRLADFNGRGLNRAHDYLKKIAKVTFPDRGVSWQTVLRLHAVRNCVVHNDGLLPDDQRGLAAWSRTFNGIRITTDGAIHLHRPFTDAALQEYERFATEFDVACEGLGLWQSVFPFEEA